MITGAQWWAVALLYIAHGSLTLKVRTIDPEGINIVVSDCDIIYIRSGIRAWCVSATSGVHVIVGPTVHLTSDKSTGEDDVEENLEHDSWFKILGERGSNCVAKIIFITTSSVHSTLEKLCAIYAYSVSKTNRGVCIGCEGTNSGASLFILPDDFFELPMRLSTSSTSDFIGTKPALDIRFKKNFAPFTSPPASDVSIRIEKVSPSGKTPTLVRVS